VAINERQRSAKVHGFNFNEPADPFSWHEKGSLHCFAIAVGEMGGGGDPRGNRTEFNKLTASKVIQ